MTKLLIAISCLLFVPADLMAQKSITLLPGAHVSALQDFLTKNPNLEFLSERRMDSKSLASMRKHFGAQLKPYYCVADLNRDGVLDFASILIKKGPPSEDQGPGLASTHRYRHNLTVVIFNGQKRGGYRVAHVEKTTGPLVSFLRVTTNKKRRLYFAVYETDEHFILSPSGNGYVVEYDSDV
jgi:hypothetical protein